MRERECERECDREKERDSEEKGIESEREKGRKVRENIVKKDGREKLHFSPLPT